MTFLFTALVFMSCCNHLHFFPLATRREGGYGYCSCHLTWWWFNFSQVGDTVRHVTMATTETIWRETIQELFLPVLLSASAYQVWLHCLDPKTIFMTLVTASVWNLLSSMLICVIKCSYEGFSRDLLWKWENIYKGEMFIINCQTYSLFLCMQDINSSWWALSVTLHV